MAGSTFITVPKDLKDDIALRRLLEVLIREIDRLKIEVAELSS